MNVAIVVGAFPAPSETFILNQITGLMDLGHAVDILALWRPKPGGAVHKAVSDYQLLERTRYFDIPEGRRKRLGRACFYILKNLFRNPAAVFKCLDLRKYSIYEAINNLFKVDPFLSKSYDVVHCHFGPFAKGFMFLKDILNVKIVTSFHGYDVSRTPRLKGPDIYQGLFKKGDLFTVNSGYTFERVVHLGCDPRKIRKLPMGIGLEEFAFAERKPDRNKKIRILTVGRLVEKKGLSYSIKATVKVFDKYPYIEYTIAGEGRLRPELEQLIHDLNAGGYIKLAGEKTAEEVQQLLKESHIFVLSSVTAADGDTEGQGVVLLEAQACGLPVIATRHNGFPESILDNESGFLVPERDTDALAAKLEYLITNTEKWPEMGRAGRRFMAEQFDIIKLNKQLEGIYCEMLNDGGGTFATRNKRPLS